MKNSSRSKAIKKRNLTIGKKNLEKLLIEYSYITKEVLIQKWITENLSREEVSIYFNCTVSILRKFIKLYGLSKNQVLQKIKSKQTKLERYGNKNYNNQEKQKKTNLEKYGVEHSSQAKIVQEKQKKTNLEKYGVDNPQQNNIIKEKTKQTMLEKYGVEHALQNSNIRKKFTKTMKQRYLVEHALQNNKFKEKNIQTNLEKYGTAYYTSTIECQDKKRKTNLEKYGCICSTQNTEVKAKRTKTWKEKYNNNTYFGSDAHKNRIEEIKLKVYKTKKKNNSFHVSSPEKDLFTRLKEKDSCVIGQYKSEKYPWNCDFYLPKYDLYIEYQGFFTHGKEPYNPSNKEHQNQIKKWQEKSKELNFKNKPKRLYEKAIKCWTIDDPEKRKWAKNHNLNWLEFFTLEEFNKWFSAF